MVPTTPPLSLYVHFPWCVRKCPYCDFNSFALVAELPQRQYVEALMRDMQVQASLVAGRPLVSVFLGGGTPSLFSAEELARVLECARATFGFTDDVEVTLEANPGTIERGRFAEYQAAGVNRVSLGAQSFDAAHLRALGRIHSPDETCRAVEELHAAAFTNFNLDLMYALPGQDVAGALRDLDRALELEPAHVSHYQLTIEAGTVFAAAPPVLPGEEAAADMLGLCRARLEAAGFAHYETSAYALPHRECRHNLNYWTFGDYLGVGAGAHGKLSRSEAGPRAIVRTVQTREPRRYLASSPKAITLKPVAPADLPFEFMLNALRLTDGFDEDLFACRTGLAWDAIAVTMHRLTGRELLVQEGRKWRPTALGARFLNDLLLEFLPESPARPTCAP